MSKENELATKLPGPEIMRQLFPDKVVRQVIQGTTEKHATPCYMSSYTVLDEKHTRLDYSGNTSCFSGLSTMLSKHRARARFLCCRPLVDKTNVPSITEDDYRRWTRLGKALGILDDERSDGAYWEHGDLIDLKDERATVPRVYMRLCWLRWLREGPGIVKHTLALVDEAGRDPWAAVAFTHHDHVRYVDQSLLPFKLGGYRVEGHPIGVERDLAMVVQIYRLTYSPDEVDNRHLLTNAASDKDCRWRWHGRNVMPPRRWFLANRVMLLSGEVLPVLHGGSFEVAEQQVEKLRQESKNVRFVQAPSRK